MWTQAPFIDFHTHKLRENDEVIEVISLHKPQIKDCTFYTIGFHPWWVENKLTVDDLMFLQSKFENDKLCLGIGECGLDNLKGVHLDLQEEIFLQQVNLANSLKAPLVVHCVRAYDRIIHLRKSYSKTPWVIHGFIRNKILAKQLLDAGFYLSVAPDQNMSIPFVETLKFLPLDRMFLETDSNTSVDLMGRYSLFCRLRSITENELKDQIFNNFKQFFTEKWEHHIG